MNVAMPLHGFVMPKHQLFFRFEEKVLQNCDGYQPSLILIDTILMAVVVPQLSCVWSFFVWLCISFSFLVYCACHFIAFEKLCWLTARIFGRVKVCHHTTHVFAVLLRICDGIGTGITLWCLHVLAKKMPDVNKKVASKVRLMRGWVRTWLAFLVCMLIG